MYKLIYSPYPIVAVILAFLFPGLGHFYAVFTSLGSWRGRIARRGLWFLIGNIIALNLIPFGIGILAFPIIWVWQLIDSYKVTVKARKDFTRNY